MSPILFGAILVVHGLMHLAYITPAPPDPKYPFNLNKSWLVPNTGSNARAFHTLGIALSFLTLVSFVLAGMAATGFIVPHTWGLPLSVMAAAVSLLLLVTYWNSMLILGVFIDLVLLVSLLSGTWQPFAAS